jgi:hypothetical protein
MTRKLAVIRSALFAYIESCFCICDAASIGSNHAGGNTGRGEGEGAR